jgi:GWxTD domain-containing protein
MNYLEHFVASPVSGAIGWTILHSLWQGAVCAALLAVVILAIGSPRIRYAAACAVMLVMLVAFSLTLAHFLPEGRTNSLAFKTVAPLWHSVSGEADSTPWYSNIALAVPWFAPVWFFGVLLIYARALASCFLVQRLRRRGVCSPQPHWQSELARLKDRLRVSRPVQLLESSLGEVPLVFGYFRPLILTPAGLLSGLPPSQVEAILLHELAHIRRNDYLINILQRLAEGLLFYHPAAWWISSVIRAERENCCDDMVVTVTAKPEEYARTLAALEQHRFSGRQPAVAITGGRLMKRIHRLLYPKTQNAAWAPLLAAAMLLTAGVVSLAAWESSSGRHESSGILEAQDVKSASILEKAAKDSEGSKLESYAKWLDQEVVYIMDDAERAAFRSLETNTERDKFIEQFWERRNPTPSSATNAFKTEHYRRIAYANQHFRTASGAPGWQTDRGHIYIVYGPPEEIDSHPKDGEKPALEYWTYRHVEGVGDNVSITFVDRTGRGDYHLAPSPSH